MKCLRRILAYPLTRLLFLVAFVGNGICASESTAVAAKPSQSAVGVSAATESAPIPTADPELTAEMRAAFGAANWIPADAGFFSSGLRLGEQWSALRESRAFEEFLALPAVQMAFAQIQQRPEFAQFETIRTENELARAAMELLSDAFSEEVFIFYDSRAPANFDALGSVYWELYFSGMIQNLGQFGGRPVARDGFGLPLLVSSILEYEEDLQVPGMVAGFRLSEPGKGQAFIEKVRAALQNKIPIPIQEESIGGGHYHTVRLQLKTLLEGEVRQELDRSLRREGVPTSHVTRLNRFLDSQTIAISLGMRGDYLLFSIGADTSHLEQFGKGISLAAGPALAPVRRHFKPRLIGLSYVDADLTRVGKIDVDETLSALEDVLALFHEELPPGLARRLRKDAKGFLSELNEGLPEAQPTVVASYSNQGVESFTFSAYPPNSMEAGESLSILKHAGASPLFALATHSRPSAESYKRAVHWVEVAYGYFEDFVVPTIPADNRADFERFKAQFLPAIVEVHKTTQDYLIPSLDGCQGLLVVDGGGELPFIPGTGEVLTRPVRYPRPAIVFELNDSAKFKAAFDQYRQTLNRFFVEIARENDLNKVQIPPPQSRSFEGGTLYTYSLPIRIGPDFEPHAVVTDKLLTVALSPVQSRSMLAESDIRASKVVDFSAPSGRCIWIDLEGFSNLVFDDVELALVEISKRGDIPPDAKQLIEIHLPPVRRILGTLKSYQSRTYVEDGRQVTHSWLHVSDIAQ